MLETVAVFGYITGITAGVAVIWLGIALNEARKRRKRASAQVQNFHGCSHVLIEFTPSTGQTRCRTCGELISQDMPRD